MRELADRGVAILMISSDMEEVIGVSDRIAVMHEGTISGFLERPQFSEHAVLRLAVGHAPPPRRRNPPMHKKDLGLLVLILVVGAITAALNPRFLSPVNLVNMANLIGLFGLFAIGVGAGHHHRRHRALGGLDVRADRRACSPTSWSTMACRGSSRSCDRRRHRRRPGRHPRLPDHPPRACSPSSSPCAAS